MAGRASRLMEQGFASEGLRRSDVSAHGHREVTRVEEDTGQDAVTDLWSATVHGLLASSLVLRAVVPCQNPARQPHIAGKGVRILLVEIGLAGLPGRYADQFHTAALQRVR